MNIFLQCLNPVEMAVPKCIYSKRTLLIIFVIFIAIVAIGSVIALEW
ncbi:transmembrane regulator [Salmonella enterica subsp. enterica]|nr:transmembrane regulator [Salmonella enterica subsp. enterica] [Salmonella enterica subsp. enterica serovar Menston]